MDKIKYKFTIEEGDCPGNVKEWIGDWYYGCGS